MICMYCNAEQLNGVMNVTKCGRTAHAVHKFEIVSGGPKLKGKCQIDKTYKTSFEAKTYARAHSHTYFDKQLYV